MQQADRDQLLVQADSVKRRSDLGDVFDEEPAIARPPLVTMRLDCQSVSICQQD
jgi:hypothetical protein